MGNPAPVFLPENPRTEEPVWATAHGVAKSDRTEAAERGTAQPPQFRRPVSPTQRRRPLLRVVPACIRSLPSAGF